jgi:DNA-binding LacI/PurR family transcriptional regulator
MRLSTERNDGFASLERQERARYEVQRRRLTGLREGFAEAGVDWSTVPVVERYDHSESAGATAAEQLLARHPDVTALVCTSDILALGALRHARQSGRAVPDELTVTGFDGVPAAERAELTTIRQPTLDKGRAAGELLLDRGDRQRSRTLLLPTELLARATSGPAHRP